MIIDQLFFFPSKTNIKSLFTIDYYYVSREEMLKAIENDEFIETTEFSNNIYGTR